MTKSFAGIGSRETPTEYTESINLICDILIQEGYTLRSGGANGADMMFQNAYSHLGGDMEIYLPYNGFNNLYHDAESFWHLPHFKEDSFDIASKYHPKWNRLSNTAKNMMARNTHQMLGKDLKTKSDFVICYTEGGKIVGGTGQVLRMATSNEYDTPVFNLGLYRPTTNVIVNQFTTFFKTIKFWS